jgi:hypothetical protein
MWWTCLETATATLTLLHLLLLLLQMLLRLLLVQVLRLLLLQVPQRHKLLQLQQQEARSRRQHVALTSVFAVAQVTLHSLMHYIQFAITVASALLLL